MADARIPTSDIINLYTPDSSGNVLTIGNMESVNTSSLLVSNNSYQAGTGADATRNAILPNHHRNPVQRLQQQHIEQHGNNADHVFSFVWCTTERDFPYRVYGRNRRNTNRRRHNVFQLIGTNVAGNSITPASCTITISPLSPSIVGIGGIISVGTIH